MSNEIGTISVLLKSLNETFTVDFDALPDVSKRFIIEYGLRQKLADSYASAEEADRLDVAQAMLAKIESGDLSRAARAASDPVETVMLRLATKQVKAFAKSAKVELTEERLEELVSKFMDKNEESLRVAAESEIAAKAEAAAKAKANAKTLAELFA